MRVTVGGAAVGGQRGAAEVCIDDARLSIRTVGRQSHDDELQRVEYRREEVDLVHYLVEEGKAGHPPRSKQSVCDLANAYMLR